MERPTKYAPHMHPPLSVEVLEQRIVEAELAGRRTVADTLASRLEKLRAADTVNVVDLAIVRGRSRQPP